MAYDPNADLEQVQADTLTEDTSINPLMPYNPLGFLNKALNTTSTSIVGSINDLSIGLQDLLNNFTNFGDKYNGIILDTDSSVGQAKVQEMQSLLGQGTILEAIVELAKRNNNSSESISNEIIECIVGTGGVQAFQIVYITSDNTVMVADCINETHADRVIGIALNTANEGEKVKVQRSGKITNSSWSDYKSGDIIWVGKSGSITNNAINDVGFIQKIGVFDAEGLILALDDPILL